MAWLFLGHYTRREHVEGTLVPQAGLIDLTARTTGTVTDVAVSEGAAVEKGQPLVMLSGGIVSASLGDTAAVVIAQLQVERERLEGDIDDTQLSAAKQAGSLRVQKSDLRRQVEEVDAQLAIQSKQALSLQALLHKVRPLLAEHYVSEFQVQQEEMAVLEAKSQVKSLARQRLETEQQLSAIDEQISQLPLDTQTKLNDLSRQLAQVQESLAQNQAERASVLRAPEAGTVSSVLVKAGQTVAAGQPVMAIIPADTPLQAELLVPSSAIGFLQPGAHVDLRYDACPYQKFGLQEGRVLQVSRNALSPQEILALVGQTPPEPLYRVRVALDKQAIEIYGKSQSLKAGMALDADILLDHRRLFEWAFEPLLGMSKRFRPIP